METMVNTQSTNRFALALIFSLGGLLIFRLFAIYIDKTDLFFDEAQYWAWSRVLDFGYYSKPPLLAWSIRGMTEICGVNEFCIRAASPIFHTLTAFFIFLAGRAIYNVQVGFWAALAFATLPGISFSAGKISTDVPLLMFWALSLWAFAEFQRSQKWGWAVLFGVAIGFGLLAKYAMAFFLIGLVLYILITPGARWIITSRKIWGALLIAAIILSPNIIWNLQNGLVTFSHTADNANWKGTLFHPLKALEFFGAQFGVFGPILFVVLIILVWRFLRGRDLTSEDRMLLAFSVPIILIITTQALLSRAHANWAATAYPAATILVMAVILREKAHNTFRASFGVHIAVMMLLTVGLATAGEVALPGKAAPFARVLGWKQLVQSTEKKYREGEYAGTVAVGRDVSAELVYYLRNTNIAVYALKTGPVPRDYYQMVRPYQGSKKPVLLVTRARNDKLFQNRFDKVTFLGSETVSAGKKKKRSFYFYQASGFKTAE